MFTTGGSAMDVVLTRRSCEVSGSPPLTALLVEGTDQSKKYQVRVRISLSWLGWFRTRERGIGGRSRRGPVACRRPESTRTRTGWFRGVPLPVPPLSKIRPSRLKYIPPTSEFEAGFQPSTGHSSRVFFSPLVGFLNNNGRESCATNMPAAHGLETVSERRNAFLAAP